MRGLKSVIFTIKYQRNDAKVIKSPDNHKNKKMYCEDINKTQLKIKMHVNFILFFF